MLMIYVWTVLAIVMAVLGAFFLIITISIRCGTSESDREYWWIPSIIGIVFAGLAVLFYTYRSDAKELYNSPAKVNERAQEADQVFIKKIVTKEIQETEAKVSVNEPTIYVIAPMSYDTQKYVKDNTIVEGLFSSSDKSVERLLLLENCITDFQSRIDEKIGVSFLDRSKITQIEKEHRFQLGDWSNSKKTAEVGKALNANILLFLDKFGYINSDDQIRFEAKFVDINTMRTNQFNVVYHKPAKKIKEPEIISSINFKDFTGLSTKKDYFEDELELKLKKKVRTSTAVDIGNISPLGSIQKLDFAEQDAFAPKTRLVNADLLSFDGFGSLEIKNGKNITNTSYTFKPVELSVKKIDNNCYSDCKVGTLFIKNGGIEEEFDVFTSDQREFYIKVGSAKVDKVIVNYYLQMMKQ